jgi:hypothetical protein
MKQLKKHQFYIHEKDVRHHESERGWLIIIFPDNIKIDNYNRPAHIHIKPKGLHLPIKFKEKEEVGLIVEIHIKKNKDIIIDKLLEELL